MPDLSRPRTVALWAAWDVRDVCKTTPPVHLLTHCYIHDMVCTGEGPPVLQMAHPIGAVVATLAR